MGTYMSLIVDDEPFEAECNHVRQCDPSVCLRLEWGRHDVTIHLPNLEKAEALAEAIMRAVNKLGDQGVIKVLPPVPAEPLPF